jgi:hypothetical protein
MHRRGQVRVKSVVDLQVHIPASGPATHDHGVVVAGVGTHGGVGGVVTGVGSGPGLHGIRLHGMMPATGRHMPAVATAVTDSVDNSVWAATTPFPTIAVAGLYGPNDNPTEASTRKYAP